MTIEEKNAFKEWFEEEKAYQKELNKQYKKLYGTCLYGYVDGKYSIRVIEKLLSITSTDGYWDKVREMCKNIHSDHNIRIWERYSGLRYEELLEEQTNAQN